MQVSIPPDAEQLALTQAAAAGFSSIDEYVASLIRRQSVNEPSSTRSKAFDELRQLRKELPRLTADEIVRSVRAARADLS